MCNGELMLKVIKEGKFFILDEDVEYHKLKIPKGTKWDGASIPRPFRKKFGNPTEPQFVKASLLHDWIYRHHELSKYEADTIFSYELLKEGHPPWRVQLMSLALALFGWVGYYWPFKKFK